MSTSKRNGPKNPWIRQFAELNRNAVGTAGGKGEMFNAGLPVPAGFVIVGDAYEMHLQEKRMLSRIQARVSGLATDDLASVGQAAAEIQSWILSAPVPKGIADAISEAYGRIPEREGVAGIAVAVRSSATAEDLPDASFAGQQETYLNVRGEDEVLSAVRKCWASLWESRAVDYRLRMGYDHLAVSLAVVVQVMVRAETAGVMFTANPLSGSRREFMITASYGLGEAVVSGLVTPDTFVLRANGKILSRQLGTKEEQVVPTVSGTEVRPTPFEDRSRYCLNKDALSALAHLGRQVTSHYGAPQDVEWAFAQGRLYLLQARPITTTLTDAEPRAARGRVYRIVAQRLATDDHFPEPLKPMDFFNLRNAMDGILSIAADLGFRSTPAEAFVTELPDGRIAFRPQLPRLSVRLLWALPRRLLGALFDDPMAGWSAVAQEIQREVDELSLVDCDALEAPLLVDHLSKIFATLDRLIPLRFQKIFVSGMLHTMLVRFWVRWAVGGTRASFLNRQLFLAVPYATARMNLDMARLAQVARINGTGHADFVRALDGFLDTWGDNPIRGMVSVPSVPTWRESRDVVTGMVKALSVNVPLQSAESAQATQEAEFLAARQETEDHLNAISARLFNASLTRARNYLIAREEGFAPYGKAVVRLRHGLLRLGDMLCRNNVLADAEDIFFLRDTELRQTSRGELTDCRERIARRRRGFNKVQAAWSRGQNWLVASGSVPPGADLDTKTARGGDGLNGFGASQGLAAGPVCVVRSQAEFSKLKRGDILVALSTAPAWTPLFAIAGGVVTEIGGALSHAAIVAREYGIPAVLTVRNATTLLEDGQRVIVDGTAGVVRREREQ